MTNNFSSHGGEWRGLEASALRPPLPPALVLPLLFFTQLMNKLAWGCLFVIYFGMGVIEEFGPGNPPVRTPGEAEGGGLPIWAFNIAARTVKVSGRQSGPNSLPFVCGSL